MLKLFPYSVSQFMQKFIVVSRDFPNASYNLQIPQKLCDSGKERCVSCVVTIR